MVVMILQDLFRRVSANKHGHLDGAGDTIYLDLFRSGSIYEVISGQRAFITRAFVDGDSMTEQLLDKLLHADADDGALIEELPAELQHHLRNLKVMGRLCVEERSYSFWTPLHMLYYSDLQYKTRRESLVDGPTTLVKFLELCVRRMSADQLRETLSRRAGGKGLLERALQMEFYRASYSLLPAACSISADVSMGTGWVDFWIKGKEWAVELLCSGYDLAEHEARFEEGGKYSLYPMQGYAVVDFRGDSDPRPRKRQKGSNTYIVIFSASYQEARCIIGETLEDQFKVQLMSGSSSYPLPRA